MLVVQESLLFLRGVNIASIHCLFQKAFPTLSAVQLAVARACHLHGDFISAVSQHSNRSHQNRLNGAVGGVSCKPDFRHDRFVPYESPQGQPTPVAHLCNPVLPRLAHAAVLPHCWLVSAKFISKQVSGHAPILCSDNIVISVP